MSLPDDEPNLNPTGFDPDVAGPREWAEMYRAAGFQVVPCKDKRPDLAKWADLQETLVSDASFARWYGTGREHGNMGVITGPCSGNVFVVDLDIQDHVSAAVWWESLIEGEANGIEPETVEQITGGGGEQKLFRAPAGYRVPTNRTWHRGRHQGSGWLCRAAAHHARQQERIRLEAPARAVAVPHSNGPTVAAGRHRGACRRAWRPPEQRRSHSLA